MAKVILDWKAPSEKKMAEYVIMQDKLNVTWRKLMSIK